MKNVKCCEKISQCAIQALLFEVTASPKPGLVDRFNSGAHKDMDIFTFMSSSAALSNYFYDCSFVTMRQLEELKENGEQYFDLFAELRQLGIKAEKNMYAATNGVNTHKGLVFSLGLMASAATVVFCKTGDLSLDMADVVEEVKRMTKGLCEKDFANLNSKEILSAGEKLFLNYGIKGIRGEVENGFPAVTEIAYPKLCEYMQDTNFSINNNLVNVLLHLMAVTEDSNILSRHDMNTLKNVKLSAKQALELGGMFTEVGTAYIKHMDRDFIDRNISPGGSADLLAVTLMFYFLKNK